MPPPEALVAALEDISEPSKRGDVGRFFKGADPGTVVMGVSIGKIFPIARRFVALDLDEVEALLDDDRYEVRMAAVAVMDFKARRTSAGPAESEALFDLYLRRHDRINNWDLVDRAAPHVIGEFLIDRDRSVLDRLAASDDPNARRTALVSTHAFIKRGEVADTFRIAERLADDGNEYVQKAVASWTREAGKKDPDALISFLKGNRRRLPKPTMTAASRGLPDAVRTDLRAP